MGGRYRKVPPFSFGGNYGTRRLMLRMATALLIALLAAPLAAQGSVKPCDLAAVPKHDPASGGFNGATRDATTIIVAKGLEPGCALATRTEFADAATRSDVIARMGDIVRGYARSRGFPAEQLVRDPARRNFAGVPVQSWSIGPVQFAEIAFQQLSPQMPYVPAQGRVCLAITPVRFREGVAPARAVASWEEPTKRLIPACLQGIEPNAAARALRKALARIDETMDDAATAWPADLGEDGLANMSKAAEWQSAPDGWPPVAPDNEAAVAVRHESAPAMNPGSSLAEGYLGPAATVRRSTSGSTYWFTNAKGAACRVDVADRDGLPAAFMPDTAILAAINDKCETGAFDGLAMAFADAFAGADDGAVTITSAGMMDAARAVTPFKGFGARALAESHPASPLASVEFVPSADREEGFRANMVGRFLDGQRKLLIVPADSLRDSAACLAPVPADRAGLAAIKTACAKVIGVEG